MHVEPRKSVTVFNIRSDNPFCRLWGVIWYRGRSLWYRRVGGLKEQGPPVGWFGSWWFVLSLQVDGKLWDWWGGVHH